ncbi:MAG: hypothetical protein KAJ07_06030 [Planctomycetes bacterium]|nr:hypothetical protein [Planctomycetota bacterium]
MSYRKLYFFVEGSDDTRFVENVLKPILSSRFDHLAVVEYAQRPLKIIKSFLVSINSMQDSGYYYMRDINSSPCVTSKRDDIVSSFGNRIDENRIVIVIKEIEGWYLAGLDETAAKELGVKQFGTTDSMTKENLEHMMPTRFDSRKDFMIEILKRFDIDVAKQKNNSFNYFMNELEAI